MDSMKSVAKPNVLIELDALLDTRVATVRKLYPNVVGDLLNNKAYRCRIDDDLSLADPRIDNLAYVGAYAKRDIETLDHARPSLMISYLKKLLFDLQLVSESNNPVITDVKVFINIYPYKLDDDRKELIALAISTALNLVNKAVIVELPPNEITLDFIKEAVISTYVLYDFNTWVSTALPDQKASDLSALGLGRVENFTVIAARIALSAAADKEARDEFAKHGMLDAFDYFSVLPWNLLFELQLLDPVLFTEFDPEEAEKIMSLVEKSNSPIDIEIGVIAEFYRILGLNSTTRGNIEAVSVRMVELAKLIAEAALDTTRIDDMRIYLAEQRFLTDSLSYFIPSHPALDFERFLDSHMSRFDVSLENSEVSEAKWNSQGVKCRRIVRNVSSLGRDAYLLVCAEDCVDVDGVARKKNSLLSSVHAFAPVLEVIPESELTNFIEDINNG